MDKIRKRTAMMVLLVLMASLFSGGCSRKDAEKNAKEKETVSVALWGSQLLENYAPWLQKQFPDVEFDFYIINNSTDYYQFRASRDTLPDLMTVRRFSLRDVENLKGLLLDLSDTNLVNTFYQSYLRNYTYADGTVNWLPACAEVDSIIVNKSLFEKYNIPLPTDWAGFAYACREFEKTDIQGYITDFSADYTCMETLQGFSIGQLNSAEGRAWREIYESGQTDGLDENVWMPVFEKMLEFIDVTGMDEASIDDISTIDILNGFAEGKIAMYRGTGEDLTRWGTDYERVMMPYPGETEEEGWYLTYPAFQVAASAAAEQSAERKELILDIMEAMLSEEGLKHISTGKNMVAYNKNVNLELLPEFSNLLSYKEKNRIYIRLASSDMFSVSKSVVQKMLRGEITDAREAYQEFDREMRQNHKETAETAVTLNRSYSRHFDPDKGNEAASAVYNTIREELGADCMLGQSAMIAGDILSGDYTDKEISFIVNGDSGALIEMELTGAQLGKLVQYALDIRGSRDSVANDSTLPAASGFAMEITKKADGSYVLDRLTKDGEPLDDAQTYRVVFRVSYEADIPKLDEAGFTEYTILDAKAKNILSEHLAGGLQLSEPADYITLK